MRKALGFNVVELMVWQDTYELLVTEYRAECLMKNTFWHCVLSYKGVGLVAIVSAATGLAL